VEYKKIKEEKNNKKHVRKFCVK